MPSSDPFDPDAPVEMPAVDRVPGPDHRAEAKPNAFWRTLLQVGPPAVLGLLVILPQILQEVVDSFGDSLPAGLYGVLVAITAAVTLIAGILRRSWPCLPCRAGWPSTYRCSRRPRSKEP